jgi:hypothetical protein
MSWLFSRALVEAFSEANCSDGAPSAPSSGNPTPQAYLPPDRMTAFSRPSRFGMTFAPLTDDHGAAVLTSFLEAFPAKTSASQAREPASTEPAAGCGDTWRGSLARFDPATSSWRTAQRSLLADSDESSVTWPRSGMTVAGQCWELPTLERRTAANDSGLLLPTPSASHCETRPAKTWNPKSQSGRSLGCMAATAMWPTPCARDYFPAHKPEYIQAKRAQGHGMSNLNDAVAHPHMFSTPTSTLGTNGGLVTPAKAREGGTLIEALSARTTWPTPDAHMGSGGRTSKSPPTGKRASGTKQQITLNDAVKWATPTARDWRSGKASQATHDKNSRPLSKQAGGSLNPDWVEWLMNWPITWSSINAVNPKEFKRWSEASAAALQESACLRTMWWDSDPSQASSGSQHIQQPEQQCGGALQQMPRGAARQPALEGSHQGQDLPVLREDLHLHQAQGEDLQQGMRQQAGMDEAPFAPRVANGVTARVDRLKAIGNGQVPLCAATAWQLLTETA